MAKKSKKSKFTFRGKIKKSIETRERSSSYGYLNIPTGVKLFKPSVGTVDLDFIPYKVNTKYHMDRDEELRLAVPGTPWYRFPFKRHENIGINNDKVICLKTFGKKCFVCDYIAKSDLEDEEEKAIRPKLRSLYAVIPLNDKEHKPSIHLFEISDFLFQKKLEEELAVDEKYENFPSPEDGYTVRVRFVEDSFNGRTFSTPSRVDFRKRKEQYEFDIIEDAPALDELLVELSYKEMKKKFLELGEEEEEEEEDAPVRKKSSKKPKKEEYEEEDDVEEEDEDFDEDELEDDDDLDEEEEEEEEDEDFDEDELEDDDDLDEEEEEEEEEEDDEEPKRKKKSSKTSKKKSADKCPFGHKFGKDHNKFDDCGECDIWKDCRKAKRTR